MTNQEIIYLGFTYKLYPLFMTKTVEQYARDTEVVDSNIF